MSMKRVTITVPDDVAQRLEGVENVSAFFTEAVRAQDKMLRTEALLHAAEGDDVPQERREQVRAHLRGQLARAEARKAARRLDDAQATMRAADHRQAA
ncbi:MAG TPA: hypothetical protein VF062_12280 [Candidatus Limnocylindrales bacterium]